MSHQLFHLANQLARRPVAWSNPGRMMAEMDRLFQVDPFFAPWSFREARPRRTQFGRPQQLQQQQQQQQLQQSKQASDKAVEKSSENKQVASAEAKETAATQPARWNSRWADPFEAFFPSRLYQDVWRDLDAEWAQRSVAMPETDVQETDKAFVVTMDIPGVRKEDIKIKLAGRDNRTLQVVAERREEVEEPVETAAAEQPQAQATAATETPADKSTSTAAPEAATKDNTSVQVQTEEKQVRTTTRRRSVSSFRFSHSLELPENVDTKAISAKCEHGQLKLTIPKLEQVPETEQSIPIM